MIVIGIVGWKDSGKTRLMQNMIKYFTSKNYTVGSIKHAHHNFDIDHEGTDSFLHRKAGAQETIVSSSKRWAKIEERTKLKELTLNELIRKIDKADIVFVEGFKNDKHKKIEVIRKNISQSEHLYKSVKNVVAIVSNEKINTNLPTFQDNDFEKIANFIISINN